MLSPVGYTQKPEDFDIKRIEVINVFDDDGRKVPNKGPPQFAMRTFWPYLRENRIKAESVTRKFGKTLTKKALDIYVSKKLNAESNPVK